MDLPHAARAPVKGGRPLKRWRYVGVFGDEVMACFGVVRIGVLPQAFWAVLDAGGMRERTRFAPRAVDLRDGVVRVRDVADLRVEPDGEAIAVTNRHGAQDIWTRKTPARARGTLAGVVVDLPALIDDSAGYHARVTDWEWAAGAGTTADGRDVRWNLVTGIHDGATGSERRVWVDGAPREVGPVTFSLVRPGHLPKTRQAQARCFTPGHICWAIAEWQGVGGDGLPTINPAEAGLPGWDTPGTTTSVGDSWFSGSTPGASFAQEVTAKAPRRLWFMDAIHPFLPMSYIVEALRRLITGGGLGPVWHACVVLVAFTAGALALTAVSARRRQVWTLDRLHPELSL